MFAISFANILFITMLYNYPPNILFITSLIENKFFTYYITYFFLKNINSIRLFLENSEFLIKNYLNKK